MTVEVHEVYQKLDKDLASAREQIVEVHKVYKNLNLGLPSTADLYMSTK